MTGAHLLVIGRHSYLAAEFAARHADLPLRMIGHLEADEPAHYEGAACAVNFAFAPSLHDGAYDAAQDIDRRAAGHAAARGMHYVMISSRRVYAPQALWNAGEDAETAGMDAYGRNKLRVERELSARLGGRLTVLRPGNVVGYEPIPGRLRFAAYLENQLRESGRVRLTISPRTRRDLVPVDFFCRAVREAMLRRVPGVFNVGSGGATAVGDAARWLIKGFGAGDIEVENDRVVDEFQLDSSRLQHAFGLACGAGEVERTMTEAGRRLAAEGPRHGR